MVLLVVLIIMLASVRVSDSESTTSEQVVQQENSDAIDFDVGKESAQPVDQALIIRYYQNEFDIRFDNQSLTASESGELNRRIRSLVGSGEPDVILLVSPSLNIRQAMNVMESVTNVVHWTEPKLGVFE